MKIYGDKMSGNCLKVRWVCDHLGHPYAWIDVDVVAGGARTDGFRAMNPAGQVPVIVLDDGRMLAQSNAIMRYLARGSSLMPADLYDAAKMDEWLFWEQYSHEPYIAVCRFQMRFLGKPASALDPERVRRGYAALTLMDTHLSARTYFVAEQLSLADIALVAYTRWAHEGGFDLSAYPHVQRWIGATETSLGLVP